jgi:hypothetical protein
MSSSFGACGTFLWQGDTLASMFRCMEQPTVIMMQTEPLLLTSTTSASTLTTTYTPTITLTSTVQNTVWTTVMPSPADQAPLTSRDVGDGSNGRERIGLIIGAVLGSVVGLICVFFIIIFIVLRHDPQWRANMRKGRIETAPTPAPAYSEEDPERARKGQPQDGFQMETVKGKSGTSSA